MMTSARSADTFQIVDVVEVDVAHVTAGRIDVARDGDVDEEQRVPTVAYRGGHPLLGDHVVRGGGRRYDDVGLGHALEQIVVADRLTVEFLGELRGALVGAVRDQHAAHAVADEMLRGEFAHLAGAQDQHTASVERLEHALGEFDRRVADRDGILADLRLGTHALADLEALAEQLVEHAAARPVAEGVVVGFFDLAEDLGLAQNHRVERCDNAEQVLDDRLALMDVQIADEFVAVQVVIVGHEVDDCGGAVVTRRGDRVDLRAVARGDDDRFGDGI